MASEHSQRPVYSDEQISRYFDHIRLPSRFRDFRQARKDDNLGFLTALQKHQLARVPFEDLALHYSTHHSVSLDPEHLYRKVVDKGMGGYCMENNCFFGTVLRTLGYDIYSVGARVSDATNGRPGGGFGGWGHMVNIVTLPSGRYAIDVGFGSNGAVQPLALRPDIISTGIGPQEHRLRYKSIIPYTNPHQKLWVFQHRNSSEDEWSDAYAFTDLEFLPMDYEMISFWTSQSGKSWFARKIVAVRMILEGEEVVGTVILEDTEIKRRIKGKTEHLGIFTTEAKRVEALKKWFDIELSEEEKGGIKGTTTQLPGI